MDTFLETANSLWRVVVIGLVFGAGLPIVFAFGISLLGSNDGVNTDGSVRRNPAAAAAGTILIGLVGVAVVAGILYIAKDFILHATDISIFGAKPKGK